MIISTRCKLRVLASVARDYASSKRCANASDHYIISKTLRNECTTQRPRKRTAGRNSRDQWKGLNNPPRVSAMGIQWRQYPRILTTTRRTFTDGRFVVENWPIWYLQEQELRRKMACSAEELGSRGFVLNNSIQRSQGRRLSFANNGTSNPLWVVYR